MIISLFASPEGRAMVFSAMKSAAGAVRENLTPVFARQQTAPVPVRAVHAPTNTPEAK